MTATASASVEALDVDDVPSEGDSAKKGFSLGRLLAWLVLLVILLITIFPFYWMIRTALSNGKALAANSGSLLPADFTWGAFRRVLGLSSVEEARAEGGYGAAVNFLLILLNSVVI
jgi:multiple sugar transport system permease protein